MTINILIADDHSLFRDGLKRILNETQDIIVVAEADNGGDALEKMRNCKWDVTLLDINLPDISGLEVLKRLNIDNEKQRVLVLSMYPEDEYAIRSIRSGAAGYLTKDSPTDLLVSVIRRLANGGKYVNPELAEKLFFNPTIELAAPIHTKFSDRELHVFKHIVAGKSLTSIARSLSLSVKTISTYRTRILEKMNMTNNAQLVRYAVLHHLID